jgi:penicillin-insensitive murein endopeptidase
MKSKFSVRIILGFCVFAIVLSVCIYWGNDVLIAFESGVPSMSSGTYSDGSISHSKRLPSYGANFSTYSRFGSLIGRTNVHDRVRAAMIDAYSQLAQELPSRTFVFGETGWPNGGRFWPHKTHENGLSVDFMVPVDDMKGNASIFPTNIFNKFGYNVEFDSTGRSGEYQINFDVMAKHLKAIRNSANKNGLNIRVVIFDNSLQKVLFSSSEGSSLPPLLKFSKKPAWVRHDEHYHIDFEIKK